MTPEPFRVEHIELMNMQPQQRRAWSQHGAREYLLEAQRHGAWSVFHGKQLLLCGGVLARIPEEPLLWSFIAADAGPHMLKLLRVVKRFLQVCGHSFVFATSEIGFTNGCRFLEMLDFEFLTVLPGYGLDGSDHRLYERQN